VPTPCFRAMILKYKIVKPQIENWITYSEQLLLLKSIFFRNCLFVNSAPYSDELQLWVRLMNTFFLMFRW
jgi:hypothetical protein